MNGGLIVPNFSEYCSLQFVISFILFLKMDYVCLFVCLFVRSGTGTSLYGILIPALEKNDGI